MVAVLFLDKLAFYAEVGSNIIISSVENIFIDLVHPDIALLYLFFGYNAVSAGSISARVRRRSAHIAASGRSIRSDAVRHGLARVDQRQIPVGIEIWAVFLLHIIPIESPRAQVDLIAVRIVAVFVPAVDADDIRKLLQARVDDPVGVREGHIGKPAALGCQRAMLASTGVAQADRCRYHGVVLGVVLIPERHGARAVCVDLDHAADIPPLTFHALI